MKKIVILNNWLISGGAEKQGLMLAKFLNKYFKVYYCVYYSHKIEEKFMNEIMEHNIELILLKGSHLRKIVSFFNFCKQKKISVIISYLFIGNLINAVVGSVLKVKHRIGGIRNSKHSVIKNFIQRFLHNHFLTMSISNSFSGKEECINYGFDANKMMVIHNCFEFNNRAAIKKDEMFIRVITVARFVRQKDYMTSIKAIHYAITNSKNKNIHYTIIGYGEFETKIRNWINELSLTNNVSLVLNPKNVYQYLAESDVYLSTSLFEGLSNSIMEAMSFSLPIVATNVGDNEFLVKNGFNGYLTKPGDFENLGMHVLELSENEKLRTELGNNSYTHLKENFSVARFEHNYLTLINQLVH
ncbi:Glycosyltransferase involved in cell wall bisynthesis [Tangfeifania diversioriginum]|uniref:Glycosyltransferase involved in cell wall bisynthesis n=1 Tax=Tangfeifania diversioriginum TaxID=1168035 RepID=A0A1M6GS24_9BACT|nr:glycosyltransferase [Tangfeifania diversioriginum]SHJ12656.1 Glycosyltransferase involved in cell wall bisynthesis [Tangfeifania diversioriginum]